MTPCQERDFMARRRALPRESPEDGRRLLTWTFGEEQSRKRIIKIQQAIRDHLLIRE
jgi:hypothetical protein